MMNLMINWMRLLATALSLMLVVGCQSGDQAPFRTSVDVDMNQVPALLAAVDALTENPLDTAGMLALTESVPMDGELQERYAVTFQGRETDVLYHIWLEQTGWVHLYFSSPSAEFIEAVKQTTAAFARPETG